MQTARKLILNEFCESRHLPLHLAHLLAHVQYDFYTGKVDAHLAGEGENHFQAFEVRIRVKAGIAFRARRLDKAYPVVKPQGLWHEMVKLGHPGDHMSAAAS